MPNYAAKSSLKSYFFFMFIWEGLWLRFRIYMQHVHIYLFSQFYIQFSSIKVWWTVENWLIVYSGHNNNSVLIVAVQICFWIYQSNDYLNMVRTEQLKCLEMSRDSKIICCLFALLWTKLALNKNDL